MVRSSQGCGAITAGLLAGIGLGGYKVVRYSDDRRELWTKYMERKFWDENIPVGQEVTYALDTGLANVPELQDVMGKRIAVAQSTANGDMSFGGVSWAWFKDDLEVVAEAAESFRESKPYTQEASAWLSDIRMSVQEQPDYLGVDPGEASAQAILHPDVPADAKLSALAIRVDGSLIKFPHLPTLDEIRRAIEARLNAAKDALGHLIDDASAKLPEVIRSIHDFISVQLALLPAEVRYAIAQWDGFRHDHPYIAAGAVVVVTGIALTVGTFLLAETALMVLELLGFSEIGPVAGSWAALIQSTFYGGATRGLFSVIQSITMGAKSIWPVAVFLGLSELTAGMAIFARGAIADLVDAWRASAVMSQSASMSNSFPALSTLADAGVVSEDLRAWMVELGNRCREAGVPEVQWLDVAYQWLYREVQDAVGA